MKELRKFLSTDKAVLVISAYWMCPVASSRALPQLLLVDCFSQHRPETLWERRALSSFLEHTGSGSAKSKRIFVCLFFKIWVILLYKKSMLCFWEAVSLVGTKLYQ